MASKKKCRQYSTDYLKLGFIPSPTNSQSPMCLLCERSFSNEAMKPSRLEEHFCKVHSDQKGKDLNFFKELKKSFESRSTITGCFSKQSKQLDKGLELSYKLSLLIAKQGMAHTVGESLIIPAAKEIIKTLCPASAHEATSCIPLSNDTVSRRIDEMADNVEKNLCNILKNQKFALQIDESTIRDNEALLLAYVRFFHLESKNVCEEMLFMKSLVSDTKGSTLFQAVKEYFEQYEIPFTNVVACATDGAAAMTGKYRGFIAHLKKENPSLLAVHCVVHRQNLVAKQMNERLAESLQTAIAAINKIKANAQTDRMFRRKCHGNSEDFERLLFHTEVRFLSKGKCLERLYEVFQTVLECLATVDETLCNSLRCARRDIAYLADMFHKLNELNLRFQGANTDLIQTKEAIESFMAKLALLRDNIKRNELHQLPRVNKENVSTEDLEEYASHVLALHEDFKIRFDDLLQMDIPKWIINPFSFEVAQAAAFLQEDIIDLQHDSESKAYFEINGYIKFWSFQGRTKYPKLYGEAEQMLTAFPSSYLVEQGFSSVEYIVSKSRNRLKVCDRGDLRLKLTSIEPDISGLASQHQGQGSH